MGIRLKTVMGYALTDYKGEDDARFDYDKWLDKELEKGYMEATDFFDDYCADNYNEIADLMEQYEYTELDDKNDCFLLNSLKASYEEDKKIAFSKHIVHDANRGLENICMFLPIGMVSSWYRFDDQMDRILYSEAVNEKTNVPSEPFVKDLGWAPPYPYNYGLVRHGHATETQLEEIKRYENELNTLIEEDTFKTDGVLKGNKIRNAYYSQLIGEWNDDSGPLCGEIIANYFREKWRRNYPLDLYLILHYTGAVKNWDLLLKDLDVILYMYWS
jgi:hypothetical protein